MSVLKVADLIAQAPERDRPDAGDVSDLVESIRAIGLLHPPVVTPDGTLVSGLRRATAYGELGFTEIPVTIVDTLSDLTLRLKAEADENTARRGLTPEEAARARHRRAEILKPIADANKGRRTDLQPPSNLDGGSSPGPVRQTAAQGLGYSATTLDKVDYLIEMSEDTSAPEPVREAAVQALGEINDGHPVDRAFNEVRQEVHRQQAVDAEWTERDRELRKWAENGETVVVNMKTDARVIAWAERERRYVRIDRMTAWGNPFVMGEDGDRETVIRHYMDHYLPFKPSLDPATLRGKVLGCWCAPAPCHGDVLRATADEHLA